MIEKISNIPKEINPLITKNYATSQTEFFFTKRIQFSEKFCTHYINIFYGIVKQSKYITVSTDTK